MFSFLSPSAPEWAKFLSGKEYKEFMTRVDEYFKGKGLNYIHNNGRLEVPDNPFGMEQLGLVNLAQRCKLAGPGDWSEIIRDHFEGMIKANEFDKEFSKKKKDFSQVKEFIGVKLYHESYFDAVGMANVICRPFASAIIEVLIFDLPQTISNIKPEEANAWNVSTSDLFRIGFENIHKQYPANISKEAFETFSIWFCQADHFFVTNLALDHNEMKKYSGSKGALVGMPHRHALLIYPIESLEVVKAINTLIPVIAGMNNEGPGSISEKLFWYNEERYIEIPYELSEKKLSIKPPNEFVEMMNLLK